MSESTERGLMIVLSHCKDPSREDEFLEWYREVHLPEVIDNRPCVVGGAFHELAHPSSDVPRYLACYQLEGDLNVLIDAISKGGPKLSELLAVDHFGIYRQDPAREGRRA